MKKSILSIFTLYILTAIAITGCQSSEEKTTKAEDEVQEAKQDLAVAQDEAKADAVKTADAAEWQQFKAESEIKIKENEQKIIVLKAKLNKPGELLDPIYKTRIETLENKNKEMKTRIAEYEKTQSDWEVFKREFNKDMDGLNDALKDFTKDTK